jgi:hypothetical protein
MPAYTACTCQAPGPPACPAHLYFLALCTMGGLSSYARSSSTKPSTPCSRSSSSQVALSTS